MSNLRAPTTADLASLESQERAELKRLLDKYGWPWQDMSTAPKDGSEFLVWFADDGHGYGYWCEAAYGYPAEFHFYAFGVDERAEETPTHWLPLPARP